MEKTTHIVTGQARLSYVHLVQPYAHETGGELKYSVTVLVPKSDTATKARIDAAIKAAIQAGIAKKWNGAKPPICPNPMYDGDMTRPDGEAFNPECKGHWVFTATCKQDKRPRVVDLNRQDILDAGAIYSGMYGRVAFDAFPYTYSGKKGIAFGLTSVQKTADGQPLGNVANLDEDYADSAPEVKLHPITGMPM